MLDRVSIAVPVIDVSLADSKLNIHRSAAERTLRHTQKFCDGRQEIKAVTVLMLAEQKERNPRAKFTRAKTLGYFYESQQIKRRIESYKYQMSHRPTARIIRTTAEKFQQSQGLTNWADRENMKRQAKHLMR